MLVSLAWLWLTLSPLVWLTASDPAGDPAGDAAAANATTCFVANATLGIIVLHHPKNRARKVALQSTLENQGLRAQWIETWSPDDLSQVGKLDECYDQFRFLREGDTEHVCFTNRISVKHVSVLMKHFEAYKMIVERNYSAGLIFEDDAILVPGFMDQLQGYITQLPPDWDLLSIGDGNPAMHIPDAGSEHIYRKNWTQGPIFAVSSTNTMRSADAYVLSQQGARKLHAHFLPSVFPIDNHLNYLINTLNMHVYWAEPTLVSQGRVGAHVLTVEP
jgi:GR25 family glycosyltransferase involved in LPS biosynthesis